ncbi:MAG: hypothetical protein ACREHE_04440 [Rhizomicrobium sp.]
MTAAGAFAIVRAGVVTAPRAHAPRVEKTPETRDLRNDARPQGQPGARSGRRASDACVSQSGTPARDPLWNASPLDTPFVAQVIGQLLGETSPAAKAQAAYGTRPRRRPAARVFDDLA